jgi:hypothetical protein
MSLNNNDDSSSELEFTQTELQVVQDLIANNKLQAALPTLPAALIVKLRQSDQHSNASIAQVAKELNCILDSCLKEAAETLKELLNAGEIRKLDALIGTAARANQLNVAFFHVLGMNLQDAQLEAQEEEDAAASRLQILQHVYTRCQEEVEKTIPPGTALLNKLLRTEQASIRTNLYKHYLTPQPTVIESPDGKKIELGGVQPILLSLNEFVDAIAKAVEQIRTVEMAGGTDRESAAVMVESCRLIAREARAVIGESYGRESDELKLYEEGLQPVFRPESAESPYIRGQ